MWNIYFQDALFAAIAAIGFASISKPPKRAYIYCALTAAAGHSFRLMLTNGSTMHMHITIATLLAAFLIGTIAVFLSPLAKTPAETYLFPALLPMIPGIYAYKAFGGLAMCVLHSQEPTFDRYYSLFAQNSMLCMCIPPTPSHARPSFCAW